MVKIIWITGTLKELKNKLHIDNLNDYSLLLKKIDFKKDKIIKEWQSEAKKELLKLKKEVEILMKKLEDYSWKTYKNLSINKIESNIVLYSKFRKIWEMKNRVELIESNFEDYSKKKIENKLNDIISEEKLIKWLKSVYYWAIWEESVVSEFKHMTFPWILINDFKQHFNKPIFTKWCIDTIMSIQIDHIFISDKGIFLIETKNWNNNLKETLSFWPIEQIQRNWHWFYVYLKKIFETYEYLKQEKFPTIYKLVVFTWKNTLKSNNQYIQVLYLNELNNFISRRFSKIKPNEYNYIWDVLINDNES